MKTAKVFMNGRSQAVRLPKEYRFSGDSVYLKRVGNAVVLIPEQGGWETLKGGTRSFTDDYLERRDQPPPQSREAL